jgi:hydroxypyruvate reductase
MRNLRDAAKEIFETGLLAADPKEAVKRHLRIEEGFSAIYVVGAGKAVSPMALGCEEVLGERIKDGIVITKYGHSMPIKIVKQREAGHPIPDTKGVSATEEVIQLISSAGEGDLVIVLISGGASSLLVKPASNISLKEKQKLTDALLKSGADISEINTVRKHISEVKGGRLAEIAYPAKVLSLILSDVVGDRTDVIGSGPTAEDPTTFSDSLKILERYEIVPPESILLYLKMGAEGKVAETPKSLSNTENIIVGSNRLSINAAKRKAEELGFNTLVLSSFIEGETREVAKVHIAIAKEIISSEEPIPKPACILSGGETTVTVKGRGKGGRNQEFVLASAICIDGLGGVVVMSCGTDGTDGPTDAAGAIADGNTIERARMLRLNALDYLERNDSYTFFEKLGDLIVTGPTRTNVMDLRILLVS